MSLENVAQYSPAGPTQLAKPSGVVKLKIKKKKCIQNPAIRSSTALKPINGLVQDGRTQSVKRANPFRCSPRKKPNLTSDAKTSECRLFNVLDGLDENLENISANTHHSAKIVQENTSKKIFDTGKVVGEQGEEKALTEELEASESLPLDWSLDRKSVV